MQCYANVVASLATTIAWSDLLASRSRWLPIPILIFLRILRAPLCRIVYSLYSLPGPVD
jgi:hypothetical protein